MDILTEQAATYDECIAKISEKYGPNVQILRQKKIRMGGFLGFFEKDGVELNFILSRNTGNYIPSSGRSRNFDEEKKKILRQAVQSSPDIASRLAPRLNELEKTGRHPDTIHPVENDRFDSILAAVKNLETKIDRKTETDIQHIEEHESLQKIEKLFEQNDFSAGYIRNMIKRAKNEFTLDELNDFDHVQDTVLEWIGQSLRIESAHTNARPHVIALVGPTGVGKTTTIAKLAAAYSLAVVKGSRPLNVRVITIDNYRIGAKQQIEIYGNIMNIPVSCAETPSDLQKLMAMYQDVDVVLIDTIGKSPRDYTRIAEMRHFLDAAGPISDMHLAISATTKVSDMREVMQQYETFGYNSIIITKFDETTRVGNIVSVLAEKQKAVAYLTTGQRVPQDFEQATIIKFLTHLEGFHVNRARIEELFPPENTLFEWR